MADGIAERIVQVTGASSATLRERIAEVWSGYGTVARYDVEGLDVGSLVAKHIVPGRERGRSHDRKLRSYDVEQAWYQGWAAECGAGCRVATCRHVSRVDGEWLFLLEDLDRAGFSRRASRVSRKELGLCLDWLAHFHATFLGRRAKGLWKTGTYWHLATRPDEHRTMFRGSLRDAAAKIDQRLRSASFQTLVHGDAKPANFCFSPDRSAVAAVDFQYVGGGCGVKDVAYLLATESQANVRWGLERYFATLRRCRPCPQPERLEREWRALYPWAWADLHRFLAGWDPSWPFSAHEQELTEEVLRAL
jgi:hypothetical protein